MLMNEYVAYEMHKARQNELNSKNKTAINEVITEYKTDAKNKRRWLRRK